MAIANTRTRFPSHAVPTEQKQSWEYGYEVGSAIESEWFRSESGVIRYFALRDNYHRLRLYARGEQPIDKYKDELAINGDLSYLNLDWKPVPIIPKFVDILVNGILERPWSINAFSQDPSSMEKRTAYIEGMLLDMRNKALYQSMAGELGVNMFQNDPNTLPADEDELSVHMQLEYKESIEIAAEEAINNVLSLNKYDHLTKRRSVYDLVTCGIGCEKTEFNPAEGIKIRYVDPVDLVYSYTESDFFDDIYYVGEVQRVSIPELKKHFSELTDEDIKDIESQYSTGGLSFRANENDRANEDGYVYVLHFEYKTYEEQVYKIKRTASGAEKAIEKPDSFNPPKDKRANFERASRSIEVLYEGAKIVGHNKILRWGKAENMTRPKSDITRCNMNYNIVATKIYQGKPESMVERMVSYADAIQRIHLNIQKVIARTIPDGVFLDADGLADIDLGNGTKYDPQKALDMFFQTGSVIGRSMTSDGDFNHGRVPIQEIQTSSGGNKLQALFASYNHYLQMIRDVTGLNEARDGSMPDKDALVGVQKLAAANSNTATRHIVDANNYLTLKTVENVVLKISDVLEYANHREAFLNSLGRFNMATLTELREMHLHDFGIFIELAPDEIEKAQLERDIEIALQNKEISIDDKYDVMSVRNMGLARQIFKIRKKKKMEQDRKDRLENIQYQAQANQQSAIAAQEAEAQKEQVVLGAKAQFEQLLAQLRDSEKDRDLEREKERLLFEYQLKGQLKSLEDSVTINKEAFKEDRKDKRTKLQAEQQSRLIKQRQDGTPPVDFTGEGMNPDALRELLGQ